ncbi:Rieske (2Fe-2S) protein [Halostella sp. JP-L12]|uniref:QcrA and Rieske domain-containing protein n=1 Tax=Halostella TaxID=1843185 RepID=UPI000EF76F4E|nr:MULTISPECIES: Rieske (2Fe-2S) protein [Halostella]NHN47759.1 Rieske (2Fe-2S) protein [Halostella sp. JP-L12]
MTGTDEGDEAAVPCDRCPCSRADPTLFEDDRAEIERRDVAKGLATVGGLTVVGSLAAPLAGLTQVFEREYSGPVYSDNVALVDEEGERITEDYLEFGDHATVFPESNPGIEDAPTLLVRFEEGEYGDATNTEWVASGYAAYSKVCTHAGCMVSDIDDATLVCPCHAGKFDPLAGASVVGGPPPRALPQLPMRLSEEGHLVATDDFEGAIGPGGD